MIELLNETIEEAKETGEAEIYYPRFVPLPAIGSRRELSKWNSRKVSATGKVVSIDEKSRIALLKIVVGGEEDSPNA